MAIPRLVQVASFLSLFCRCMSARLLFLMTYFELTMDQIFGGILSFAIGHIKGDLSTWRSAPNVLITPLVAQIASLNTLTLRSGVIQELFNGFEPPFNVHSL